MHQMNVTSVSSTKTYRSRRVAALGQCQLELRAATDVELSERHYPCVNPDHRGGERRAVTHPGVVPVLGPKQTMSNNCPVWAEAMSRGADRQPRPDRATAPAGGPRVRPRHLLRLGE